MLFDYYCPSCNKMCNFDEEIEIQYIDIHVICGTPVQIFFNTIKIDFELFNKRRNNDE